MPYFGNAGGKLPQYIRSILSRQDYGSEIKRLHELEMLSVERLRLNAEHLRLEEELDRLKNKAAFRKRFIVALRATIDTSPAERHVERSSCPRATVPSTAEAIISYVCRPDCAEAVLGDLQRNFSRYATRHGEKAARRWYWWQTIRTGATFCTMALSRLVLLKMLLGKLGL